MYLVQIPDAWNIEKLDFLVFGNQIFLLIKRLDQLSKYRLGMQMAIEFRGHSGPV